LRGYRRHRVWGADYPAILPETDGEEREFAAEGGEVTKQKFEGEACVRGTVVSGLTEGDVWRLDVFEGSEYERKEVEVEILDVSLDEAAQISPYPTAKGIKLDKPPAWATDRNATNAHVIPEQSGPYPRLPGFETPEAAAATLKTHPIRVETKKPQTVNAQTYIWIAPATELEAKEWDFEEFKRDKMRAWMGDGSSWSDDNDIDTSGSAGGTWDEETGVQVDRGFADVDNAVAEQRARQDEMKKAQNGAVGSASGDPTRGRGANGYISRQLEEARGK
jgi:hypothetical protein